MIQQIFSYAEIVIKISPSRSTTSSPRQFSGSGSPSKESKRTYDALIYSKFPVPQLTVPERTPVGQPNEISGLPLIGRERITVRWSRYQEYLAAFVEGDKAPYLMRERLLEVMPGWLESLFTQPFQSSQPVRVWWASDTPELEDLPWELLTYGSANQPAARLAFVRGLPPETPVPILPIGDRLRLAFIHDPSFTPPALLNAIHNLSSQNIEVVDLPEFPRKGLERVVQEGFELVHIVADGIVSSAYEGVLYFHGGRSTSPEISPGELSAILRGSRVSVLSLTAQKYSNPDTMTIAGVVVPSAYRAFAYLGSSRLLLPSIVTPLGPLQDHQVDSFWSTFYNTVAETLSLQKGMLSGRATGGPMPIALFLRHPYEVLFRRRGPAAAPDEADPSQIGAALQLSHELVAQLKAHNEAYGSLPESVNKFIESESIRQQGLATALDPWLKLEQGES